VAHSIVNLWPVTAIEFPDDTGEFTFT